MDEAKQILIEMSNLQKYMVLLLHANGNDPIKGNSRFQKELLLIAENVEEIGKEASFDSDMQGPWSENAKEQLEDLEMDEVVSKEGNKMQLSPLGKKIAAKLQKEVPEEHVEMISDFKELLNDLPDEEALTLICCTFPEFAEELPVKARIEKNRPKAAISLYKKEKISLQKAAEISGINLEKFTRMVRK